MEEDYRRMIHEKGWQLFGSDYDKRDSDRRIDTWLSRGMTLSGIWKTIRWWYDFEGHTTEESHGGFGIVPYAYGDARKWWSGVYVNKRDYQTQDAIDAATSVSETKVSISHPHTKRTTCLRGMELR